MRTFNVQPGFYVSTSDVTTSRHDDRFFSHPLYYLPRSPSILFIAAYCCLPSASSLIPSSSEPGRGGKYRPADTRGHYFPLHKLFGSLLSDSATNVVLGGHGERSDHSTTAPIPCTTGIATRRNAKCASHVVCVRRALGFWACARIFRACFAVQDFCLPTTAAAAGGILSSAVFLDGRHHRASSDATHIQLGPASRDRLSD